MDDENYGQEVMRHFIEKAKNVRNMDELKKLREEIADGGAEGFLFPLTRSLDAVITGNKFWVEILSPEVKGISVEFIKIWSKQFDFELKDKKVTQEERIRFGYKPQYTFERNILL